EASSWYLACCAPVGGDLPIPTRFIVSQDVHSSIIGIDFEPALGGSEPAVDDGANLDAALTAPERKRLLFGAVARVTFDTDGHVAIVLRVRWRCARGRGYGRRDASLCNFLSLSRRPNR